MRFRWDIAVAKGENTNVDVRLFHVIQTLVHRPLIGGDVIFHRDNVVPALPEPLINDLAILFEVFVGRGKIDRRHDTRTASTSLSGLSREILGVLYNVKREKSKSSNLTVQVCQL